MSALLSIIVWNTEWAAPGSARGGFFERRLRELDGDVICLTEGHASVFPASGHAVTSEADYGYPLAAGRRKVLLWSRAPWQEVDVVGSPPLPPGRFVAGTTETPVGPVRFIGVCIPWRDAHVRTGRRDRKPWEDHVAFLQGLRAMRSGWSSGVPTVLLGDFNQRVPRTRQPAEVYQALVDLLSPGLRVVTAGEIAGATDAAIDHVAVTAPFQSAGVEHLDRHDERGVAMSDHAGLRVTLRGGQGSPPRLRDY